MTEDTQICPFYADLTKTVLFAASEIIPAKGIVRVHHLRNTRHIRDGGAEYPLHALLEDLKTRVMLDGSGLFDMDAEDFAALLHAGVQKNFLVTMEELPNIIHRYLLVLVPVREKGSIYVIVMENAENDEAITLMVKKAPQLFRSQDIIYVDYGNHSVEIHGEGTIQRFFSVSFADVAETLLRKPNFIRSYKNCVVNMDYVRNIEHDAFMLTNGENVAIPKRRLKAICDAYEEYAAFNKIWGLK